MAILAHRVLPMPTRRDLDWIVPPEPTEASKLYHREKANAERAALDIPPFAEDLFTKDLADIRILAQCSVIPPSMLEIERKAALMDALNLLVEDFGLYPVLRSIHMPQGLPLVDGRVGVLLNQYGYGEVWRAMRLELAANGIES